MHCYITHHFTGQVVRGTDMMLMYIYMVQNLWDLYQISRREAHSSILFVYMQIYVARNSIKGHQFVLVLSRINLPAVTSHLVVDSAQYQ